MILKLKQLGKHTLIYGLGNTLARAVAFFLIPLYTAYLTPSDYGILQICRLLNAALTVILLLGMNSSMFRVYYNAKSEYDKHIIVNSTFITFFVFSVVVLIPLFWFSENLSKLLLDVNNSQYIFNLLIISIFLESLFSLLLAVLRAEERSILYALINLLRVFLYTAFSILLISGFKMNYVGSIKAGLISFVMVVVILIPITLRKLSLNISLNYIKEILHIGIPIALGVLALWILNLSDRYMLRYLLPDNIALFQIGLYSLGDRIASIVRFLVVTPFMLTWGAFMFQFNKDPDAYKLFEKVFRYFNIVISYFGIFISIFSKEIIEILSKNDEYNSAYKVVPILVFSKIFSGLIIVITAGVIVNKKSIFVTISTASAAMLNLCLNYLLIKKFGMYGAASSSLISYIFAFMLLHHFSRRIFAVKWGLNKNLSFLFLLFVISLICVYFEINILYKFFIFLSTLLILLVTKMINRKELNSIFKMIRVR